MNQEMVDYQILTVGTYVETKFKTLEAGLLLWGQTKRLKVEDEPTNENNSEN